MISLGLFPNNEDVAGNFLHIVPEHNEGWTGGERAKVRLGRGMEEGKSLFLKERLKVEKPEGGVH